MQKEIGDETAADVIMAPVLWAARRMAESPVGVLDPDDSEIHLDHDVAKLLRRPNPWYAGSTMRMALAINYLMDGNGYMRKIRDTQDKPGLLIFIPSWCIEPVDPPLGKGYIDQYQYNPGGLASADQSKTMLIPARDIVHLRYGIDPNNTRKGISPLKILMREIYSDVHGASMTAMMLKNAGILGVIISPKVGSVTIGKAGETKKYFEDEFKGSKLGGIAVFNSPTDVANLGVDASKFDLSKLREIPEERICALLNLPAAVVGFGTGMQQTKVGATMVELRSMAYEDCIIPTQNSWCDELDLQLLPDFEENPDDFHCEFDNSKVRVLQDDENKISERLMRELTGGGITLFTFHEETGRETKEAEKVYYIPSLVTVTPEDEINAPPKRPAPAQPVSGAADQGTNADGTQVADGQVGKGIRKQGLHGRALLTPKLARLQHRLMREERAARKAWQPKLAKAFRTY